MGLGTGARFAGLGTEGKAAPRTHRTAAPRAKHEPRLSRLPDPYERDDFDG